MSSRGLGQRSSHPPRTLTHKHNNSTTPYAQAHAHPNCKKLTRPSKKIQIQIQIESLHTRLDETDEMTNTASSVSVSVSG